MLEHKKKLLQISGSKLLFGGESLENHSFPPIYGVLKPTAIYIPVEEILKEANYELIVTDSKKDQLSMVLDALDRMRVHLTVAIVSNDPIFLQVGRDEETNVSKSSSSARSKKTVMEHCYEPEMVEAYRESMLKAFKRILEDGIFSFVICMSFSCWNVCFVLVVDRNLRVPDFAPFRAVGKGSGYEVYVLEATYKDPAGCAARNVHGFTLDDIQQMAGQWKEAPSLYLQLDIRSLSHGDDLKKSGIREVDMDMKDGDHEEGLSGQQEQKPEKMNLPAVRDLVPEDSLKDEKRWDAEGDHPVEVKELSRSKWSIHLDEDEREGSETIKENLNALSGLIQACGKKGKSVHWSDKPFNTKLACSV
ncbi:uncharacterized protein LOC111303436 [Durio zibethinus]|uniref:Uncharacterized protein LOC111303436 n=1 Tax=Durio zibethinus TaxID=66656 RepID=A0A6P5ZRV2_DURZI|nr:uncharacterized protein LOC111303436 [Durio zibethinus]